MHSRTARILSRWFGCVLFYTLALGALNGSSVAAQEATQPETPAETQTTAPESQLREFRGATMGTSYMVKIFGHADVPDDEIRFSVDAELRRVNDQMSTYLRSSEISKFNVSDSTDWFPVSQDFADVVDFAQAVSAKTDGAFDVTVGPLVNAWSFGPAERTGTPPTSDEIASLMKSIGYQKLSVRLDPPALKKNIASLQVDLSAIAKGHGVDRVARILEEKGIHDFFVEIGGEVRTSGSKDADVWQVGIQLPDSVRETPMLAHAMSTDEGADESMATSGDYRNYYEVDGKRISHTIDPRTGQPIEHSLASVTVIADSCMAADAWATALNVVGQQSGMKLAKQEGLSTLLIARTENGFEMTGTGSLAQYVPQVQSDSGSGSPQQPPQQTMLQSILPIAALTFVVFSIVLIAMAVGVLFGGKSISGSCGGLANKTDENGATSCSLCSNPSDACKELREKMQSKSEASNT
ncbi:FAD:protein FMN transferase [Stieleria varia]|nr:FAD:protein FMN transferase [Stieleria varia]